jgi:hypothetical protein
VSEAIDRADIDFMVGLAPVRENLGIADEEDADSADGPQLSRASYVASANVIAIEIVVASTFASVGSIAAALIVASSGGGFGWATIAAGGSALVFASVGFFSAVLFFRQRGIGMEAATAPHSFVLLVCVRRPEREQVAKHILMGCGAQAVRLHEIEIANCEAASH